MTITRRGLLKASVASAVATGGLTWFGPDEAFAADTVVMAFTKK